MPADEDILSAVRFGTAQDCAGHVRVLLIGPTRVDGSRIRFVVQTAQIQGKRCDCLTWAVAAARLSRNQKVRRRIWRISSRDAGCVVGASKRAARSASELATVLKGFVHRCCIGVGTEQGRKGCGPAGSGHGQIRAAVFIVTRIAGFLPVPNNHDQSRVLRSVAHVSIFISVTTEPCYCTPAVHSPP